MLVTLDNLEIASNFPFGMKIKYETTDQKLYFYYFKKERPSLLFSLGSYDWNLIKNSPELFQFTTKHYIKKLLNTHTHEVKEYLKNYDLTNL